MFIGRFRYVVLTAALAFAGAGVAAAAPKVKLVLSQMLVVSRKGTTIVQAVPKTGARRSQVLRLTLVARNDGTSAAYNLEPTGTIDKGEEFVGGSASRNAPVTYSLDGKTFAPRPLVDVKQPDGKVVKKPAPASAFVAVRWHVTHPLPPKKSITFTYEVRIR